MRQIHRQWVALPTHFISPRENFNDLLSFPTILRLAPPAPHPTFSSPFQDARRADVMYSSPNAETDTSHVSLR